MDARHWVQQSHVLGAVERETLSAVIVHHLWDAGEHTAALVQGVAIFFGLGDNDMNAALARPESYRGGETRELSNKYPQFKADKRLVLSAWEMCHKNRMSL